MFKEPLLRGALFAALKIYTDIDYVVLIKNPIIVMPTVIIPPSPMMVLYPISVIFLNDNSSLFQENSKDVLFR